MKKINKFSSGDSPQRVFIVFGLKPQDVDGCHYSDSECFGDTVFDKNFNINQAGAQQALLVSITFHRRLLLVS